MASRKEMGDEFEDGDVVAMDDDDDDDDDDEISWLDTLEQEVVVSSPTLSWELSLTMAVTFAS